MTDSKLSEKMLLGFMDEVVALRYVATDGTILWASKAAHDMLGSHAELHLGVGKAEIFSQFKVAQPAPSAREIKITDNDGRARLLQVTTYPVPRELAQSGERVTKSVEVVQDVTQQAQRMTTAERMSLAGTLAAGIAHEINNPLTYIAANLALALEHIDAAQGVGSLQALREVLSDAREGAERVRKIVANLKVSSQAEKYALAPVQVCRTLEAALLAVRDDIAPSIRVVKNLKDVPMISASEPHLTQVFENLLLNAIQAMSASAEVDHELRILVDRKDRHSVLIEISDTGPGMSTAIKNRVFDPFFTDKSVGQGAGLGLSICYGIVNAMQGQLTIESEMGKGTIVRVILPSIQGSSETLNIPAMRGGTTEQSRAKVLVIDDEPSVAMVIRRLLSTEHDVETCDRAQPALDRINAGQKFDIILCDLMMPGMNGANFYQELARSDREQAERVVFISGGTLDDEIDEFVSRTGNPKLSKPFDYAALRAMVRSRLAG